MKDPSKVSQENVIPAEDMMNRSVKIPVRIPTLSIVANSLLTNSAQFKANADATNAAASQLRLSSGR